jgi:hypothetical protein
VLSDFYIFQKRNRSYSEDLMVQVEGLCSWIKQELDFHRFKIKMGEKINKGQYTFGESLVTRPSDCRRRV